LGLIEEERSIFVDKQPLVYLIIHELFGIQAVRSRVRLVTPDVSNCGDKDHQMHAHHTYKIARYKDGVWQKPDVAMRKDRVYRLIGVTPGKAIAARVPQHPEFNAHPNGKFALSGIPPYCQWDLDSPAQIYQVRLLSIPDRPLFTGRDGLSVDKEVKAIGLVQVFEYAIDSTEDLHIVDDQNVPIKMDYAKDQKTGTVNLHLWAQIEDESQMSDEDAKKHSICATEALKDLFQGLDLHGQYSLSVDKWFESQLPIPDGIRFAELMTLSERFAMQQQGKGSFKILCSAKTCGHGSNLFIDG
jgi:hypothetical protein